MLLSVCVCSGERSYLAPPPYSGERSYLAPPPYNVTLSVCLSVPELDRGDAVWTVCLSVPKLDRWGCVCVWTVMLLSVCVCPETRPGDSG